MERTQPGLPLGVGEIRTKTHDYKRHGTVTLFAALEYLEGKIHRQFQQTHTHKEWLGFLKHLDRECPEGLTLHLIVDNYSTHKHAKVLSWITWRNQRHAKLHGVARIEQHFTPTASSWMNLVERFFRDITQDVIREGSFAHVQELIDDMELYLKQRDAEPRPYRWNAKGEKILEKIKRARTKLKEAEPIHSITDHYTSSGRPYRHTTRARHVLLRGSKRLISGSPPCSLPCSRNSSTAPARFSENQRT